MLKCFYDCPKFSDVVRSCFESFGISSLVSSVLPVVLMSIPLFYAVSAFIEKNRFVFFARILLPSEAF